MSGSSFSGKVAGARRALGDYSAIVKTQETDAWAEDEYGKTIAEGEAGVDDAKVIQSALDYADHIFISEGEYLIDTTLLIKRHNIAIVGASHTKTVLKANADISEVLAVENYTQAGQQKNGLYIANLRIDCNSKANTGLALRTYDSLFENLRIDGFLRYGINTFGGTDTRFYKLKVNGLGSDTGVGIRLWAPDNTVQQCIIANCRYGIEIASDAQIIVGNHFWSVSEAIWSADRDHLVIVGNYITASTNGITVTQWHTISLEDIIIVGNLIECGGTAGINISTPYANGEGFIIQGNTIWGGNTASYGIYVDQKTHSITKLVIVGNSLRGAFATTPIHVVADDYIVKYNVGYSTDSFLYTGLSVAVGGGSYGSATEITSLSGIISSFDAILHVTAGAGEVITVKFECVWDDGTTTYITKSLDNSAGTAAASQDFEITAADKIALWKNNSSLRKINVYAMSNLNPPTTSAKVTVDIAGSG